MKLEDLYQLFLNSPKITTDSRQVEEKALFFALQGEQFDGNAHAETAIQRGCSYAIVDNPKYVLNDKYILVDNVLQTLQGLANHHRKQLQIPIIAITGTNGKTTTKELIAGVLSKSFRVSYTKGNLNNHIGVPLTLLSMDKDTQIGIVEMGANHMNEINDLCEIAGPDFGIITNIGKAHLEGFGSYENIIHAKTELYKYLKGKKGKVFYNSQNSLLQEKINEIELDSIAFGDKKSSISGELVPSDQFLSLNIKIADFNTQIKTHLVGNYNLENVLAAACIGHFFHIDPVEIVAAIQAYTPQNNRSQFLKTSKNNLFLDAYNANPTSVEASVRNFGSLPLSNKSVVLGDMLELGNDARDEHQKIMNLLKEFTFDKIILIGTIYSSLKAEAHVLQFNDVYEAKVWLKQNIMLHSNVLIKGSRGIRLEQIVELL